MTKTPRLQQLLIFLENNPNDSFVLFALAKEHEKLNQLEEALQYYTKIMTNDPDYVGTYYHLGKLYEKQNKIGPAFQTYKEGIAIAKKINDSHAMRELAEAKLILGDDEDFD